MIDLDLDWIMAEGELIAGIEPEMVARRYPGVRVGAVIEIEQKRTKPALWNEAEDQFVRSNYGFFSEAEIGAILGRSEVNVKVRRQRHLQMRGYIHHPELMTAQAIGRALGLDSHNVMAWQDRGIMRDWWLIGERRIRLMRRVTVYRWAVNPMHWPYFIRSIRDTRRVGDEHLRRLIERQKARWADEWWTPQEVADWHGNGVCHQDVNRYIRAGRIEPEACLKWDNWMVRESAAKRVRFVKGKGQSTLINYNPEADAFLLRKRAEGLSSGAIARLMKWPESRVRWRYHCLMTGDGVRE